MNVTCTGCPAKYSVPDEKVRGKKVRITCKHCGTNIVVDGSALGASASAAVLPQVEAPSPAPASSLAAAPKATTTPLAAAAAPAEKPADAPAPAPTAKHVAAETSWLVGFIDDRQEPHTTSSVVELYATGKIDDETLLWKDGMADWLSPFDVPEIALVLKQRGVARRAPSFALPLSSDDEQTVVGPSALDEQTVVTSAPSESASTPAKAAVAPVAARQSTPEIKPAAAALRQSAPEIKPALAAAAVRQSAPEIKPTPAAAEPVAARRSEKRPEVDLFGGVANAGSEADVSLDFGVPEEPAHKMTGARNESSVLFSLDALTKPDAKAAGQKRSQEKEQEKQATAALFGDSAPDSLMNMGGGGLAALAAPDFTKPVAAAPDPVRPSDPVEVPNTAPNKKKGGAGVVIAAVLGIAAAAGLAIVFMSKKPIDKPVEVPSAETKAAAAPPPVATATETAAPSAAPETASAAPVTSAPPPAASAGLAASAKPIPGVATTAAPGTPAAVNKPAERPAEAKPEAPAAPAAGADFDKGAAIAALSAAAASAASCKKPDGPTGGGKASVTFAPSGRATNSTVTGAFAGTDVGGCVARVFRSAKVPPFGGDPVTVSKSFSIE